MAIDEVELLKIIVGILSFVAAILGGVMTVLLKRLLGSVTKTEFGEFQKEYHEERIRILKMVEKLFENAETDRRRLGDNLSVFHSNIHDMHLNLLDKIKEATAEVKTDLRRELSAYRNGGQHDRP